MNTKNRLKVAGLALLIVSMIASAAVVYATEMDKILSGTPVGKNLTAVSTDVALVCRYVGGGSGGGEMAVAAGGDITLTVDGSADTTTECPVSGAYGGVIDVSDASCNTLGEVVDAINFSANWRCAIVNGLRSDSSNDTLATFTTATADSRDGLALKWDTAVELAMTQAIIPTESIQGFLPQDFTTANLLSNPFKGTRGALLYFSGNVTTGGAATITVYSVKVNNKPSSLNAAGTGFVGSSETVTTLFSIAGGATTVDKTLDFTHMPLLSKKDEKLVVREAATTSLTAPVISSWGTFYTY